MCSVCKNWQHAICYNLLIEEDDASSLDHCCKPCDSEVSFFNCVELNLNFLLKIFIIFLQVEWYESERVRSNIISKLKLKEKKVKFINYLLFIYQIYYYLIFFIF